MKNLFFFLPILLLSISCSKKVQLPAEPEAVGIQRDTSEQSIRIKYQSATDQILVENEQITQVKTTYFYPENSPTAVPDSSQTETLLNKVPLSEEQLHAFRQLVDLGFFELQDEHGAPETARHYTYSLQISYEGLDKKVIYRAHPAYEEKPMAFANIEEALLQMVRRIRE